MRTQKLEKLDDDSDRSFKPQIFLDQLIKISQTMKKLSFLEIRDHCDTIIFAVSKQRGHLKQKKIIISFALRL
jgi:hypothetical protein